MIGVAQAPWNTMLQRDVIQVVWSKYIHKDVPSKIQTFDLPLSIIHRNAEGVGVTFIIKNMNLFSNTP